jgi:hypothetical protein
MISIILLTFKLIGVPTGDGFNKDFGDRDTNRMNPHPSIRHQPEFLRTGVS